MRDDGTGPRTGDATGSWVCLFSGGKDSSYALYLALERGLSVERLCTVHPTDDSYLYHVPETDLARLAAESIGVPHVDVDHEDFDAEAATDSGAQGDRELVPLERTLRALDETLDGGVSGVIAGAVESEFQTSRIEGMCDRLDCDLFAPLWRRDALELGEEMLEAGFEILIVQVAAAGLDETWLGRTLDATALAELEELNEEYGVHVLGEGGEFETLVVDAPHMDRSIDLTYDVEWDGTRGRIRVTEATLT